MKDFRNILRRELKSNVGNTVKGFVGELIEEISFHLEKRGIKSSDADDIARSVVDALRESMGGCQLYFPKLNRKDNSERDAEILREYKRGAFVNELAIKHNVSLQTIYCAIKKARERQNDDDDDQ
ncbi:hypothetical protein FXQ77_06810 [Salmonella enterica]|nr:hypothetical protein [Salmonella enterica]ECO8397356.1 hypothetical protein [Salmonella enterica]EDS8497873.1 hypothetical protein [Salmonella enterica subsp. enterica serovar Anatum]EHU9225858.1 hypothetical protein [Salmonella enterica]